MTQPSNLKMLGKRVLLQKIEEAPPEEGKLVLINPSRDEPSYYLVVGIGEDPSIHVKVGDKVILDRYGRRELVLDETTYVYVPSDEILAILCD